ncbi:hypothetical protein OB2597_00710 [Pseudooceanicola batsensis HTCC2597]|uniref:MltA-interacting MipA n=1 Tax=Pseudooceanicola batsensis (strain ATCC BAA-863 / DSM 15984 / KCTC 12145 / HTCC2597) TaxID=252305 RepID=A3U1V9_PSEBH|nr:MipA/OmpV family protein [Pseudooceanicola batsensis]EAQ01893.1 hypothetical protein OB2597_00710 [Pseudooceanicola batsensis HTCC2597]
MLRICLASLLALPVAAAAQEAPRPVTGAQPDLVFTLRGGAAVSPSYFGSSGYELGPDASFSVQYLRLGGFEFGSPDPDARRLGFGLRGSFRYISARNPLNYPELAGLEPVDRSVEVGLGVGYRTEFLEAFLDARYGVIGHESWVAEAGVDAVFQPEPRLRLRAGPRIFLGDDDYARTYFGVTPAESAASGLAAYDPSGGALSAGIEIGATYRLDDNWAIDGAVTWSRFIGDAEASPIVAQGSRDQWKIRLGVTRRFSIDW